MSYWLRVQTHLGKGPKKCKSVVFDQRGGGGGQPEPHPYCKNNFFLKLSACPQTCPIHGENIDSAVVVNNFLCSDHFLID